MAFSTNLVALNWSYGKYSVESQLSNATLNKTLLREDGLLHDISGNPSYRDEGAVIHVSALPRYFDTNNSSGKGAIEWHSKLPDTVEFVLIHLEEWESGMN